jgi:hypothetical protein
VASPGEYLQRRVTDLEGRVAYLESYLGAIFGFFGLLARRRHAASEASDIIDAFQRRMTDETAPLPATPSPAEPAMPAAPETPVV